jgi:hypothetical protein
MIVNRVNVLRTCLPYLFDGIGIDDKINTLLNLAGSISNLMDATCDYDQWKPAVVIANRRRIQRLHRAHLVCLAQAEKEWPETEFSIYLHETIHLCETIAYWNNTRNYWCFVTERFVGYMKGFVKNRRFPVANVVRCPLTLM